jgi:uncharacterized protein YjeT (DUF2065 family)
MAYRTLALGIASVLGALAIVNGIFMLIAPQPWYVAVPGVTTTGPFNQHFIRDIGFIFLLIGAAFLVGAARREARLWLWGAATLWLCGHALFHLWEVAAGICGPGAIARDFPAVSLPSLIGLGLTSWAIATRPKPAR